MANKTVKMEKPAKTEKEEDILTEFKSEVMDRKKKSVSAALSVFFVTLIVFGLLGVAAFQIFLKPEQIDNTKKLEEKIENAPIEEEAKKPTPTPKPSPAPTPKPSVTEYTVAEGDTWSSIANANGMSSANLMKYNGATSEDLQIGQKIKIPKN